MKTRRSINVAIVFVAMILMFTSSVSWAIKSGNTDFMDDPLFGITYRPSKIFFEKAPNDIYKCSELKSDPVRILYLFGKYTKGKTRFYYVSGLIEYIPDGPSDGIRRFTVEEDEGIIVAVTPDGCHDIGAGYAWSPDKQDRQEAKKYGITEDIASVLLDDALNREIKAFGGVKNFFRKLAENNVDESLLPSIVIEKLSALRKKSGIKAPKPQVSK
jgi:hypothetical protein